MAGGPRGSGLRRRALLLVLTASLLTTIAHYRRLMATALHRGYKFEEDFTEGPLGQHGHQLKTKKQRGPVVGVAIGTHQRHRNTSRPTDNGIVAKDSGVQAIEAALRTAPVDIYLDLQDRIKKTVPRNIWGGPAPSSVVGLYSRTGCNVLGGPFAPPSDATCQAYLSNISNWMNVTLMTPAFDERTIKFRVRLREEGLSAVLKVSQRLFPNEPHSEYMAFVVDRALRYNRVPPTAWVETAPLATVRRAVEAHRDPKLRSFAAEEFLDRLTRQKPSVTTIEASVQLWVWDVHHLLDTVFAIPYRAHNGSWHRYFNPAVGYPDGLAIPVHHLAQQLAFDFVISNNDRSPNKNNFVVGGCSRHRCKKTRRRPWHPGPPDFVYLDHGMAFYHSGPPADNPLSRPDSPFCLFRRPVVERFLKLEGTEGRHPLTDLILPRAPTAVIRQLGRAALESCQTRLDRILATVRLCLTKWPAATILVP